MGREVVSIWGIPVDRVDLLGLIRSVDDFVRERTRAKIMYANVHVMNLAYRNRKQREALKQATLVYCDGEGVRLGARILGRTLPQRMTGADWIWDLCFMCEKKGHSLYLLGGAPGIAQKAGLMLSEKYPGLEIAGAHHGFFEKDGMANNIILSKINDRSPDILLVGFGSPLQEGWIHDNFERIDATVVWAVGGLFDFVSGNVRRGPRLMVDHGLEWLFRLIVEPGRLWKRYLIGNSLFVGRVLRMRFRLKREGKATRA